MKRASVITWSAVAGIVVVGGIVAWAALVVGDDGPTAAPSTPAASGTPTSEPSPGASTTPPATAEPSGPASASGPAAPGATTTPAPAPPADPAPVSPLVTFDQWTASTRTLAVGATVPGVVETGGTCTLSVTDGAATVEGSFAALPSASSTDCGSMSLQSDSFSPGQWTVSVTYVSATSAGSVDDYEVTIP
ncbi:hypothetical protein [Frigoribacterium endophyticum]|uniref:hypothetical protein n=1 Tax=Frigoribacterium endophyticum TaxID=1522176 RepID=UPI0014228112|nr:hypothetical protein [Frigoribacterium endophyticum]NII50176.1 hypothetical protein [Frigoribacterium endophyticum]